MTKINIYCVFDSQQSLHGVYSSVKAAHRDALQLCNTGHSPVYLKTTEGLVSPSINILQNIFKGEIDIKVQYVTNNSVVTIIKTGLKD
jgi:hypothetical protein